MIRERERVRKAKWRANKRQNDPNYVENVREYDRKRKRIVTSRKSNKRDVTKPSEQSTPRKKPPSYYKVLSTSKKVQDLLGPSPKTHTTILKHLLNKAIKSPRKSHCMGEFTSPPKNYVTPPKESVGKQLRKIVILRSKKNFKEAKEVASSLKSKFKVAEIAAFTGEKIQTVYRLLSPKLK